MAENFLCCFRETHGSGASYHKELAKELATFLQKIIMVRLLGFVTCTMTFKAPSSEEKRCQ